MDDEIMAAVEKQRKAREKMNIFLVLVLAVAAVVIYTIISL